jgi:hypothetical protein
MRLEPQRYHNFAVGPNGMMKVTPKFQSVHTGPSRRREK